MSQQPLNVPRAVFLHQSLDLQHLVYPSNKIIPTVDNQAWHFLCSGRDGMLCSFCWHCVSLYLVFRPQLKLAGAYCFWAWHVGFSVVCPWFCLSVGLSHKMVQFASNKDQNVPRCCPATFWSRSKVKVKDAKCWNSTAMFLGSSSVAPLLFKGWMVKDTDMPKWFFGCNSTAYGLIYFRYRPQFSNSGAYAAVPCTARFLIFSCFSSTVLSAVCWVRGGQYPACRQACSGNNQRFHFGKSGLTWSSRSTHVICCHVTLRFQKLLIVLFRGANELRLQPAEFWQNARKNWQCAKI